MKKIWGVIVALAGALFAAQSAQAGVIYRWVDERPDPEAGRIDAFLEFGEEFWSLGRTYNAISDNNPDTLELYTGLESLHFGLFDAEIDTIDLNTDLTCALFAGNSGGFGPRCRPGVAPDTRVITGGITTTFMFDLMLGDRLSGSIIVNDGSTDFRMSSLGSLFTISRLGSDLGVCFRPGVCDGGTGYFQLDRSTVPTRVPEPALWSLMIAGLLLMGVDRRPRLTARP